MASEQPPFNPLTRSNQQIRRACLEIYRGQSRHTLLAALQSHSISRSSLCLVSPPTSRPAGRGRKGQRGAIAAGSSTAVTRKSRRRAVGKKREDERDTGVGLKDWRRHFRWTQSLINSSK